MIADTLPDVFLTAAPGTDFFLARQPILNRDQRLVAYELLFRSAASGPADVTDDLSATATVIAHAAELGMERVIGESLGFVNVDAAVLMSDFVKFLPRDKIVLEILETVEVTPRLIERISELVKAGFTFALDDVVTDSPNIQHLLPLVKFIKIDVKDLTEQALLTLSLRFKSAGKILLAEKVESLAQFQYCLDLGFDYFQGYYFAKPLIMSGKKLAPSELVIIQLMGLIIADADSAEIERLIKKDAALSLNLLRLVNTPAAGVKQRMDTLSQALLVLGRSQLQRWLQILLYAGISSASQHLSPLLLLAATRGKLIELMAEKLMPGDRNAADVGFTVGIMSLMDALFGLPMADILTQMPMVPQVSDALLHRRGIYGNMLALAECVERPDMTDLLLRPTLQKLQLSSYDLYQLELAAFEWSEKVARSAS